jgi:hypothetical protein
VLHAVRYRTGTGNRFYKSAASTHGDSFLVLGIPELSIKLPILNIIEIKFKILSTRFSTAYRYIIMMFYFNFFGNERVFSTFYRCRYINKELQKLQLMQKCSSTGSGPSKKYSNIIFKKFLHLPEVLMLQYL